MEDVLAVDTRPGDPDCPLVLPGRDLTWRFRCQEVFSVGSPFWLYGLSSVAYSGSVESRDYPLMGRSTVRSEGARRRHLAMPRPNMR
jgi:hypothetical protein